jgi:prepilin-type N-terminal cleavage/methylation domain-containing protein
MARKSILFRRPGFTLIEVLVTIVVIGVLAAAVIPAVTAQVTAGDASRVFSDLDNVRTGIENFDIAVKGFPGDVGDLTFPITTADKDAKGFNFLSTQTPLWAGPYIESALAPTVTAGDAPTTGAAAFNTGYAASIDNKFVGCMIGSATLCDSTDATADYVVIHIDNVTQSQSAAINDLIDGVGEANASSSGRFRCCTASSTGFFFASPLK